MSTEPYVFSLPPRPQADDEDDWERYSENVRPTRRGRRVDILLRKAEDTVDEPTARSKLDDLLSKMDNPEQNTSTNDELAQALSYCAWFEQHLAIGSHKLYYELLWKIISRDGFIAKFASDERMLKIWEKLADNSGGHAHEIYQFAISRKSLIRCASLYVRWSQCVELSGAVVEARRVLILAKANCALPLELINSAEDGLEMREMRRHLERRSDSSDEEDDEETRKAFTQLPTIGDSNAVPVVRIPSLCSDLNSKPMKHASGDVRIGVPSLNNEVQPFEVYSYGSSEDVEYLRNVHELSSQHVERYAIRETENANIQEVSTQNTVRIVPITSSSYEVWSIDAPQSSRNTGNEKLKLRMAIKRIFKELSFEEYAAEMADHPSMRAPVAKKLDFNDTL